MAKQLRFPVLKDIEYIDLTLRGETKLMIEGKEAVAIEGTKWRDFEKYVGVKLGAGTYAYKLKHNKDNEVFKGRVKAIVLNSGKVTNTSEGEKMELNALQTSMVSLTDKVNQLSKGNGVSVDLLIEVTKSSYENRITFLNLEIKKNETDYNRLQDKYDKLESKFEDAEDEIGELTEKTGMSQYITIAKEFLQMKQGKLKGISNLQDSRPEEVPFEIIEVLGVVNWSQVDENILSEIVHYLKIFCQKLPLKGV